MSTEKIVSVEALGEVVDELVAAKARIAELEVDKRRLDWVLPILSCTDGPESETDARALRVAGALMLGKTGRAAIDAAMEGK